MFVLYKTHERYIHRFLQWISPPRQEFNSFGLRPVWAEPLRARQLAGLKVVSSIRNFFRRERVDPTSLTHFDGSTRGTLGWWRRKLLVMIFGVTASCGEDVKVYFISIYILQTYETIKWEIRDMNRIIFLILVFKNYIFQMLTY